MLTKDLLFQNNSRIKWYLLFLKLCRHIRRKPNPFEWFLEYFKYILIVLLEILTNESSYYYAGDNASPLHAMPA